MSPRWLEKMADCDTSRTAAAFSRDTPTCNELNCLSSISHSAGAWKWNFSAPKLRITVSKMPNWRAVKVPIITQRAPRPCVQSLTTPVSFVMFIMREGMEPSPPAPALFTLDSKVSAGWEMIADTTPATTPELRDTPVFKSAPQSDGLLPMFLYIAPM